MLTTHCHKITQAYKMFLWLDYSNAFKNRDVCLRQSLSACIKVSKLNATD